MAISIIETNFADEKEPPPPFVITPGSKLMDKWVSEKLSSEEVLDTSYMGYINNRIAFTYQDYLFLQSCAGPNKRWKIFLLDSHGSHCTDEF